MINYNSFYKLFQYQPMASLRPVSTLNSGEYPRIPLAFSIEASE
jgi:hypothetical protein